MKKELHPSKENSEDPHSLDTYIKVFGPEWGPTFHDEDQNPTEPLEPRIVDALGQIRASEHPLKTGCAMILEASWRGIKTKFSKKKVTS